MEILKTGDKMAIQDEKKRWEEETLNPTLKKFAERKDEFKTSSGIEVPRIAPDPELASDKTESLGFPGE